ncbi:RNA-directed DNA polymerase, eukaryota, reverse transcriptase zinc-binding domain protein [Tanacetum coccineum]
MVGWIMKCVRTIGFSICINGERHSYFKGGRGLRQGDPISPYLFTLIMEILTLLLQRKIRNNNKFKYHHGCKELQLVNLCFADDLMIFCNGDPISAELITEALNEFSKVSGLFPNLNKSTLFFCLADMIGEGVWKWPKEWNSNEFECIPKHPFCLWLAMIGRLLTQDKLFRRISLAAVVYFIWKERNQRIFRRGKRNSNKLYDDIIDVIKLKLMNIKEKDSRAVRRVADI